MRKRKGLSEQEKFLLKIRGLKVGDKVLIRIQDWKGRHRFIQAKLDHIYSDCYRWVQLIGDEEAPTGYYYTPKYRIEERILKVWWDWERKRK
ncbi:MAG: hypothetical protein DRP09_18925 [Candidatus Thorarchaeota archaeon]|nr:MAG: hypothetical protein DRP09_18925 [Candidatus Thorarchaeota archaeon]